MREEKVSKKIDPQVATILDAMGFEWLPFYDGISQYSFYKNRDIKITEANPCYEWCKDICEKRKNGLLNNEEEALLLAINFKFEDDKKGTSSLQSKASSKVTSVASRQHISKEISQEKNPSNDKSEREEPSINKSIEVALTPESSVGSNDREEEEDKYCYSSEKENRRQYSPSHFIRESVSATGDAKELPTLKGDAKHGIYPTVKCYFCNTQETRHYCQEVSTEPLFVCDGSHICGKAFCHNCKEKVGSESSKICPACVKGKEAKSKVLTQMVSKTNL